MRHIFPQLNYQFLYFSLQLVSEQLAKEKKKHKYITGLAIF